MNILWLGGIILPRIAKNEKIKAVYGNGWLVQLSELIGSSEDHKLAYVFDSDRDTVGATEYYFYYGIACDHGSTHRYGKEYIDTATTIIRNFKPDIVHIWGTEYVHTLAMVEACERLGLKNKVVISIQGLVSYCYYHYNAYLPFRVVYRYTIRDIIKGNLCKAQKDFKKRGELEQEALRKVKHVIGRTEWDKICVHHINASINYHHNNETLREEFYYGKWNVSECTRHTVFCSQSNYPIKGIHIVLEAIKILKKTFPNVHLNIGGKDYMKLPFYMLSSYGKYLVDYIRKNDLEFNVSFLGHLNAQQMKDQYLDANVFVSASSIENSPNSLGEAMILGVPAIASDVGGVRSVFRDNVDGLLYPADEPYILAAYIERIFLDDQLALDYGINAMCHARETHDASKNYSRLMEIYQEICNDH